MSGGTSGTYDAAPGNVSNVDIHTLLYPGNKTLIYSYFMPWFCMQTGSTAAGVGTLCQNHLQVGYNSNDASTIDGQMSDMARRGLNGTIVDWYGPTLGFYDSVAQKVAANLEGRCSAGGPQACPLLFALMEDQGSFQWSGGPTGAGCPQDGAGVDQTNCILSKLESDMDYANSNYFGLNSYLRVDNNPGSATYMQPSPSGQPVVLFFICEECWTNPNPNWKSIWDNLRSYTNKYSSNAPAMFFIFRNSPAFSHADTDGGYAWVNWDTTNGPDPYGLNYLASFYTTATSAIHNNPHLLTFGGAWKGFDESNAPWLSGTPRIIGQQCGNTWLQTVAVANQHYSSTSPLPFFGVATWNDYEEGTEIETGIDNCLSLSASLTGTTLSWKVNFSSASGSENTVDHYVLYDSPDGHNLTQLDTFPSGTHSADVSQYSLLAGQNTFYIQAVGKPSILNHLSNAVAQPGSIIGTVKNSGGTAISGATVSYSGGSATTAYDGSYSLANVPAGTVSLTAAAAGYSNSTMTVTVTSGGGTTENFTVAPLQPPSAVSVTPSSGSGTSQAFQFVFSDPDGHGYLSTLQMLINGTLSYSGACATYFDVGSNSIWLIQDSGNGWLGPQKLGTTATLQNSQCTLDVGRSSASGSGNNYTLTLALAFISSFVGDKKTYSQAINTASQSSGWQELGTWTPATAVNVQPSAVSVAPNSGSGLTQTFQYSFSDVNGYSYITTTQTMINGTLAYGGSCSTYFDVGSSSIWLIKDDGSGWLGPKKLGTTGTLANSQCTLDTGNSSASGSGNTLTLNLALAFSSNFVGVKNQYLLAVDNSSASSTWQKLGTWTPATASNIPPTAVSVTPNSGSGLTQTFQYSFSDTNGFGYITTAQTLMNGTLSYSGSCATYYDVASTSIWLIQDNGSAWSGPTKLGTAGTLQNSQCTLNTGSSSVTSSGNTLTLNLVFSFASSFVGAKNQYQLAIDSTGQSSGWQNLGTWTPAAASSTPPSAVSITPNAGSGLTQNFQYVFSDANGYAYIKTVQTLTGASLSYPGSCTTYFDVASSSIWLIQDSGAGWIGPKKLGTAATLQNSQCTLDVGSATASGSGNTLTLTLPLTFSGSFTGTKSSYSLAIDNAGASSGWQNLATWTVP